MRYTTLSVAIGMALAGCGGGDAGLGESCANTEDCQSAFQCVNDVCVHRCQRSPECGDGYACGEDGICRLAQGKPGDTCRAEIDCGPGLSCQLDGAALDDENRLLASCTATAAGRPSGSECFVDRDCRNGTCALGHCIDLCGQNRDCAVGNACMAIPRVEAFGALFGGCLPSSGNIVWTIPVVVPTTAILMPVPSEASYASLVFEVDDPQQQVGATRVVAPSGHALYSRCPSPQTECSASEVEAQFYANGVRHAPQVGLSVLAMPSSPSIELETGVYYVQAQSFRPNGDAGTAIPKITAVVRIGSGGSLDLHLHFLDLSGHPCQDAFNNAPLTAQSAAKAAFFRDDFLAPLRGIFTRGGISFGSITYHDIKNYPELDSLDIASAGKLLELGKHSKGINVFFVRTLSPVGLQGFGPSPGPAGLAHTTKSGIVIGLDTLCYRSWQQLARLAAHEIARYMGLYRNVEVDTRWRDPIIDSDNAPENLMFFSELGGSELSTGQLNILTRSPVLR